MLMHDYEKELNSISDEEVEKWLKENTPLKIVNEDGTDALLDYPENPLKEKWAKLYPPIPKPQYSQVCDGYSCMWCDRCPEGSNWKVPEEDLEIWNKYLDDCLEYDRIHNPTMYKDIIKYREEKRKEQENES